MNLTALQSTLREMRKLAMDRRAWAGLAVLSLIIGLIGPFGTFEMPPAARLAYWTAVVLGTSIVGTLIASLLERLIGDRLPWLLAATVAGSVAGPPIAMTVVLINAAAFGVWYQPIDVATLTIYCVLISAAVTVLSAVFSTHAPPTVAPVTLESAALLARLPHPQRGRLLHIAVADHYVEVTTDKGTTMLLMRLSDAILETAPVRGLQVHRSHWVALDAISKTSRQAGKPVLELETGATVPISRTYLAEARAAGLVP